MNGTAACILALSGMTGPEHILDAKDGGLYQAVSDTFDMGKLCKDLGKRYVITEIDKKPYPCCRTTHHAIAGWSFLQVEPSARKAHNPLDWVPAIPKAETI